MARKTKSIDFERALNELESLVESMEEGELTLEQALGGYERGIALSRTCQQALDAAEQRIQVLTEAADGEGELRALDPQAQAAGADREAGGQ